MITYLVGSGGHYSNWGDAYNSLAALGNLTSDYQFKQISDITNSVAFGVAALRPNGHTVKFYCEYSDSHQGNPNMGFKTYIPNGGNLSYSFYNDVVSGSGIFELNGLNIISQKTIAGGAIVSLPGALLAPAYGGDWRLGKSIAKNLLIKGTLINSVGDVGLAGTCGVEYFQYEVSNCKIWNFGSTGLGLDYGLSYALTNPNQIISYVENVTIYNCARYQRTGIFKVTFEPPNVALKNVVVARESAFYNACWSLTGGTTYMTVNNCADSDGTCPDLYGSNNQHNIIASNEFESLISTNDDFLSLNNGQLIVDAAPDPDRGLAPLRVRFNGNIQYRWPDGLQLYNGGAIPSLSLEDIAGAQYGKYGYYPIGCHNAEIEY